MPRLDLKTCRYCGRHADEVGPLSHSGQCGDCGAARLAENVIGLATKSGPPLERWRRAMAACVGGVLLDDYRETP